MNFSRLSIASVDKKQHLSEVVFRWARHVARMEEGRRALKIITGTPAGKRPLGRSRRRWEGNVRMDLKGISILTRNWLNSAQDRDYWSPCECGIEPPGSTSPGVN